MRIAPHSFLAVWATNKTQPARFGTDSNNGADSVTVSATTAYLLLIAPLILSQYITTEQQNELDGLAGLNLITKTDTGYFQPFGHVTGVSTTQVVVALMQRLRGEQRDIFESEIFPKDAINVMDYSDLIALQPRMAELFPDGLTIHKDPVE